VVVVALLLSFPIADGCRAHPCPPTLSAPTAQTEWGIEHTKNVVPYANWTLYVEHYGPTFKDYFFHFDSWEHLRDIVSKPGSIQTDDRVARGVKFAEKLKRDNLQAWRDLFKEIGAL
jgi:hypothetical protein